MRVTSVRDGDAVRTPRGDGIATAIQGAPGSETIVVRLANQVDVEFRTSEVWLPGQFNDMADIETFLEVDGSAALEAIDKFLSDPNAIPREDAPEGGRTLGAKTHWCDCSCGRANGCMRLSTAPAIHQPQTGACRCAHKGCGCA